MNEPRTDPRRDWVIDAAYKAIGQYEEAKRVARGLRAARNGKGPTIKRGTGRSALAVHVTDAVIAALHQWEAEAARTADADKMFYVIERGQPPEFYTGTTETWIGEHRATHGWSDIHHAMRFISEGEKPKADEAARTADRPSLRAAAEYALDAMVRQGWDGSAIPRLTQSVAALRQALEGEPSTDLREGET